MDNHLEQYTRSAFQCNWRNCTFIGQKSLIRTHLRKHHKYRNYTSNSRPIKLKDVSCVKVELKHQLAVSDTTILKFSCEWGDCCEKFESGLHVSILIKNV